MSQLNMPKSPFPRSCIGSDPDEGWFAFDLIRPGQPPECQLEWDAVARLFRDGCDANVELPAGGGDQPSYPVTVNDDGRVVIDFRDDE